MHGNWPARQSSFVILGLMLVGLTRRRHHVLAPARVVRQKNCRVHEASGGTLVRCAHEAEIARKDVQSLAGRRPISALSAGIPTAGIYSLARATRGEWRCGNTTRRAVECTRILAKWDRATFTTPMGGRRADVGSSSPLTPLRMLR